MRGEQLPLSRIKLSNCGGQKYKQRWK